MRFDPDMPFGTVSPVINGVAYWQSPYHYDLDYNCVDIETGKVLQKAEAKPAKATPAKAEPVIEEATADDDGLMAWAKGEKSMQWFAVRGAMTKAGFDPIPSNGDEARAAIFAKARAA